MRILTINGYLALLEFARDLERAQPPDATKASQAWEEASEMAYAYRDVRLAEGDHEGAEVWAGAARLCVSRAWCWEGEEACLECGGERIH